jgi:hypothetical protein
MLFGCTINRTGRRFIVNSRKLVAAVLGVALMTTTLPAAAWAEDTTPAAQTQEAGQQAQAASVTTADAA